jgi:hypothetical protein
VFPYILAGQRIETVLLIESNFFGIFFGESCTIPEMGQNIVVLWDVVEEYLLCVGN